MPTRRQALQGAALLSLTAGLLPGAAGAAGAPLAIPLWPGPAPGGEGVTVIEEIVDRSPPPAPLRDRIVRGVREPAMTAFRPATPNGASLLIIPGGGYRWVVRDKEGFECAARFAAAGVTVYVMTYRLPGDGWAAGPMTPLQDAQRALRLVRAEALRPGSRLDPGRVGVMGFSAGGHVAGCLSLMFDTPAYAPVDDADALSARPDLSVLVYPVATMKPPLAHAGSRALLIGETASPTLERRWSLEDNARPDAPPTFLLHAVDDASVPVGNSLQLEAALRAAGVSTELHLFEEGGHGFGLRFAKGKPVEVWPDLVLSWQRRHGFLPAG
ncbi:MAG: alpha/beta hydrolase fold domain-containing protein [Caulobacter sp.]|nr:alpha/beta hydrolase fold domain-containing protein [Caulobacter sp.]